MICPDCFEEKGEPAQCPHCGFDESRDTDARRLPIRSKLRGGRYLVGRTLGHGGFGLTYKAFDSQKFRAVVVIKECLLTSTGQVWRSDDQHSIVIRPEFRETFQSWLIRFSEEARRIAQFRHPNIVRIVDFFEENNTAYYVMPLVEGTDLRKVLELSGGQLTEPALLPVARALISALSELHKIGIIHRDIKPQNIILTSAARQPVIIDFGAAIDLSERNQSRSSLGIQTDGYSPIEQVTASRDQGPWTDIYALCATLYRCLAGSPPPPSDKRIRNDGTDRYIPIERVVPSLSVEFAQLINRGLSHSRKNRIQSASELLALLPKGGANSRTSGMTPYRATSPGDVRTRDSVHTAKSRGIPGWLITVGWFAPSIIGFAGVFTSSDRVGYLSGAYFWLFAGNAIAWAIFESVRNAKSRVETTSRLESARTNRGMTDARGVIQFLDGELAGTIRTLKVGERLTIGRGGTADVAINNKLLSKNHVSVRFDGAQFEIEDLGSTNGTFLVDYSANDARPAIRRIQKYLGFGCFCLGPYEEGRTRIACSLESGTADAHIG